MYPVGRGRVNTNLPEIGVLAGEGNRTLVSSLEGYSFTIKLHPHWGRPSCRACTFLPSAFSMASRLANFRRAD
jgi:hypothetical protein